MSDEVEQRFRNYQWDKDERWIQYKNNLYFPSSGDERRIIEKYKIKYYNQYVEPYTPKQREEPKPQEEEKTSDTRPTREPTNTNQDTNTSTNNATRNTSTQSRQLFSEDLQMIVFCILNGVIFVCSLIAFLSMFSFSRFFYQKALILAIISYAVGAIRNHGLSFSIFKKLSFDINGQYLLISFLFLTTYSSMYVGNIGLYALCIFCSLLQRILQQKLPSLERKISPYLMKILEKQQLIVMYIAFNELIIAASLIFGLFFGDRSIFRLVAFFHFLCVRYIISPESRQVDDTIGMQLNGLFYSQYCPGIIRTVYQKIRQGISAYIRVLTTQYREAQ
jgi:hypothetical protein